MTALGYHFRADLAVPAVLWPAAGVLFSALWMCERRAWPLVLLVQICADLAVTAFFMSPYPAATAVLYAVSNSLGGLIGASLARRYVSSVPEFRTARSLQMLAATAVGSLTGALPGVWANYRHFDNPMSFFTQLEIWSAGNWLGIVAVVPVLNSWLSPLRQQHPELKLRSCTELLILIGLLAAATTYVFGLKSHPTSLLQVPFTLAALMLYAAYRLPPRWAATLAMLVALASVELAGRGGGPFSMPDAFTRNALLQGVLATLVMMSFVMSLALVEIRMSASHRVESEARYRSLVELSTDAIWRVELDQPMSVALDPEEQIAWLRRHARVAESNKAYLQVDPGATDRTNGHWQRRIPWSAVYEARMAEIARGDYAVDGLRFSSNVDGRAHTYLAALSGVVRDGMLLRIWGVAGDITELVDLNNRLQREQDRLRIYARQIVVAEEKARRATAVDLHDGIGQSLVGMAMTLNVARERAPADIQLLIDEARTRLREVQDRTRHMISDLSPPGLYELGLGPALQWLAVYMRGHDRLQVSLALDLREEAVRQDTRILVFKLVRELLRNVVKHAGVSVADVIVRGTSSELEVVVADKGRGFDAQIDMFGAIGAGGSGFGLWSIAERVQEVGGRFTVDAAPGIGARFVLHFPLGATGLMASPAADTGS
jgi:signal transduction histidine kinase